MCILRVRRQMRCTAAYALGHRVQTPLQRHAPLPRYAPQPRHAPRPPPQSETGCRRHCHATRHCHVCVCHCHTTCPSFCHMLRLGVDATATCAQLRRADLLRRSACCRRQAAIAAACTVVSGFPCCQGMQLLSPESLCQHQDIDIITSYISVRQSLKSTEPRLRTLVSSSQAHEMASSLK